MRCRQWAGSEGPLRPNVLTLTNVSLADKPPEQVRAMVTVCRPVEVLLDEEMPVWVADRQRVRRAGIPVAHVRSRHLAGRRPPEAEQDGRAGRAAARAKAGCFCGGGLREAAVAVSPRQLVLPSPCQNSPHTRPTSSSIAFLLPLLHPGLTIHNRAPENLTTKPIRAVKRPHNYKTNIHSLGLVCFSHRPSWEWRVNTFRQQLFLKLQPMNEYSFKTRLPATTICCHLS